PVPIDKPHVENGDPDVRLIMSTADAPREVAPAPPGLQLFDGSAAGSRPTRDAFAVRATEAALDELVVRLVHAGIAVRELAPVISPLEAAFLALTETQEAE